MKAGLLQNKNAQQGIEKKTEILNVRVTRGEKEQWRYAARREGITLASWVERTLNEKCNLSRTGT